VRPGITLALVSQLAFLLPAGPANAQAAPRSGCPETISVMQLVLRGELLAHARYVAYAARARQESYPRIAALALALAASEGIHARNFQSVLRALGQSFSLDPPTVPVADTRSNLRAASTAELDEIDVRYPQYLSRIRPESHPAAIAALTHAWQAEKQHRDLITELVQGSGLLFGVLAKTIEGTPVQYFVCGSCGSTLPELPGDACPVCGGPVSRYSRVDTGS
jgi:rubrerythrin